MPFTTNAGVRLFWDEKGSGPPVLLVMGASYSSRMWYPVIDALAEHHRVLWFDNRGIGQSSASKSGSIEDMAFDAVAVLDAAGVDKAHVYGVSLGGVVVLQLALQCPERVRSLVVGCSGILSSDKRRAPKAANVLAYLPRGLLASLGKKGYGSAATPEAIATDLEMLRTDARTPTGLIQQQQALRAYSVTGQQVATLAVPVLVLHGTEDKVVKPAMGEELAATVPGAVHIAYPGAGHNFLVAYKDKANADVLAFLDKVGG
ncbi:MAG: putative Alpha/beta hydrolase fold protein [Frankiales bacterium]|nr:putative Alpha/beta hydrolase fold protein [Frankiales bacterium]